MQRFEIAERKIYEAISASDGVKARTIAAVTGIERKTVNHYLYASPLMAELCYQDKEYRWHSLISQQVPHYGLQEFSGFYSTVKEFLALNEEEWLSGLKQGCYNIGRNLNDTRGLIHSFRDCRETMLALFSDLKLFVPEKAFAEWEICFEFRIKKSRHIRIYADVLLITGNRVFSLEFKMKDEILKEEIEQAAKYVPFLEIIFGSGYEVIPVLVLTAGTDLFRFEPLQEDRGEVAVSSGDMLFNVLDYYMGFLPDNA